MGKSGLSLGLLLLLMLLLLLLGLLVGLLLLLLMLLMLLLLLLLGMLLGMLLLLLMLLLMLLLLGMLLGMLVLLGLPPSCASVTCCFASYMRPLLWRLPMADAFRALCAELVDAWLKGDDIVGAMNRARAALADEPPEPAPPADGEVAELVRTLTGIAHWRRRGRPGEGDPSPFDIRQADRLDRAAELLQRLNPPQPVPVSERLPGPGDCTTNPRTGEGQWCWGWVQHDPIPYSGRWRMIRREWLVDEVKAWLPAHALPLPEVGE